MWELFIIVIANMLLRVPLGNILGCGVVMCAMEVCYICFVVWKLSIKLVW